MDLAEVIRRHGPAYLARHGARLAPAQRAALAAILRCHTPACGVGLYVCPQCQHRHAVYHRCGHRACGQCGEAQRARWRAAQEARLLPVPYFLLTCTVPAELRGVLRAHPQLGYALLLQESAAAVQDVARLDPDLRGELGLIAVLHTWTRDLRYHPHVHFLVPAVAWRADGSLSFPRRAGWLLSVRRLSARLRTRLQRRWRAQAPELYAQISPAAWRRDWVAHAQPVGRGRETLSYLSRYIYKTALSQAALCACDATTVTFRYRDRQSGQRRRCQLPAEEFLRRFLQHVLPKGFHRVRHGGWLSPAAKARWEKIAALLDAHSPELGSSAATSAATALVLCPCCGHPMRFAGHIARAPP